MDQAFERCDPVLLGFKWLQLVFVGTLSVINTFAFWELEDASYTARFAANGEGPISISF